MNKKGNICPVPFYRCEINYNGNITACCPSYCKNYVIGNLLETSLDEIWRGERAEYFRNHILDGDYSVCDLKYCTVQDRMIYSDIQNNYYENGKIKLPLQLVLGYDTECNLAYNTCRKKVIKNSNEELNKFKKFEDSFFPWLGNCEYVLLSGSGDPFGSAYSRGLIERIVNTWPNVKFKFLTNGLMLTPVMYFNLGLDGRVDSIAVSIHAATADTYRAITRSGEFNKLLRNLNFFADLKREYVLPNLAINFVVCRTNYHEMPAFAELAAKHDATCYFTVYRDRHGEPFSENFADHAIYQSTHNEHYKLLEVLKDQNLRKPHCRFDGLLKSLQNSALKTTQCPSQPDKSCRDDDRTVCLAKKAQVEQHYKANSPTATNITQSEIFSGLPLKDYQVYHLLNFNIKYGFENQVVLEMGSDIPLSTAQGMLRLGASRVYAVNPGFPSNMAPPDPRIILIRNPGEDTHLQDACADIIFGIALLEHVLELEAFVKECKRMLKPDGICFLQGNPLWTCAQGHHTWIRDIPGSGNSYFFHHNSPWEDWEHLCISTREEAEERLRQKGLPETDIPILAYQLLEDPQTSRKTPTEIENIFLRVFGDGCIIKRQQGSQKPNEYFNEALRKYERRDLLCADIKVIYSKLRKNHKNYDWLPIVSLGHTPFTAHFLDTSGIKAVQNCLPNALPFDYAYHSMPAILKYLRNNFQGYLNEIEFDADRNYWVNIKDCIYFNHDSDCGPEDGDLLKDRINKRIITFRNIIAAPMPCVFIFSSWFVEKAEATAVELLSIIKSLRHGKPFLFILLGDDKLDETKLSPEIYIIREEFPCANMSEWWKAEVRASTSGQAFISNLAQKIKEALVPVATLALTCTL